jgi:hypothetical protein
VDGGGAGQKLTRSFNKLRNLKLFDNNTSIAGYMTENRDSRFTLGRFDPSSSADNGELPSFEKYKVRRVDCEGSILHCSVHMRNRAMRCSFELVDQAAYQAQ